MPASFRTRSTSRRYSSSPRRANSIILIATTVERYCRRITARVKLRAQPQAPRFDSYAMALQAAVDGVGVAIGLRPYVEDDLAWPGISFTARFGRTMRLSPRSAIG
jgi:DNA-binding transcriptional LysR family regulator